MILCNLSFASDSSAQQSSPCAFPTSPANDDELAPEVCMINEFTATAFAFYYPVGDNKLVSCYLNTHAHQSISKEKVLCL